MPAWGIDWLSPVRSFRNFFGTYGTTQGSIRGILNAIVPVAIVDRYRDDDEGSLFAITASANVAANNYPAFSFGSVQDDWELFAINMGVFFPVGVPQGYTWMTTNVMLYSPDTTYQPVVNFSPAGLWVPGLVTNWSYTLGSVTGITGYNPTLPARFGTFPFETHNKGASSSPVQGVDFHTGEHVFDPPIRTYRDVSLGVLITEKYDREVDFICTVRYRIRPRTTDGPRTG